MENASTILKFDSVGEVDKYKLRRIEGKVTADSMIRLISIADLKANPREPKDGSVTGDIIESLTDSTDIFHFKSKGILVAAGSCESLDRNRFRIRFEDEEIEGILDGGHNLLAIAVFILREILSDPDKSLRGIKRWDQVKELWDKHIDAIEDLKEAFEFLTPIEIIFPHDTAEGREDFVSSILEIAQARNNNAQLTEETKANKAGYYDKLKDSMEPVVAEAVEWKTNDGGRIRAKEAVALSWVALSKLDPSLSGVKDLIRNPVALYRNKGACVKWFNDLIEAKGIGRKIGAQTEVIDPKVISALGMMSDLPKLYDLIYQKFPEAYNDVAPGFGRIRSVRLFENGKYTKGDQKYLRTKPKTKYYAKECRYDFPEGFIMPIVFSLSELMEFQGNELVWTVDPFQFVDNNLVDLLRSYHGWISMAEYDPQKVGKQKAVYAFAQTQVKSLLILNASKASAS